MSYDLPVKRCFNLEDHTEHSWVGKREELYICPGMPAPSPSEPKSGPCAECGRTEPTNKAQGAVDLAEFYFDYVEPTSGNDIVREAFDALTPERTEEILAEIDAINLEPAAPDPKAAINRIARQAEELGEYDRFVAPEPRFPIGKCKSCRKDVGDVADGKTIVFCSYECYCNG